MTIKEQVISEFKTRFKAEPSYVVRAPGRVNIIGEHTDYNEGFVLPMAIDRNSWMALRPRTDRIVSIYSMNHKEEASFDLDNIEKESGWQEYPKGVAVELMKAGKELSGWEATTICDVPLSAGLSSSASFELAVARAFACVSGFDWKPLEMAVIGQKAENQWVGVNCGIMDQMISAIGRQGHAVLIDCRNFSFNHTPLPAETSVVIMDTATRRGLVESAYNERREQCEKAASFFGVKYLRDVSSEQFSHKNSQLDQVTRKRARHVITENKRTVLASEAMKTGDTEQLGILMNQSHDSLRDDFEVTNKELDIIVQIARETQGCIGARMTGAGFGGCAVALVDSSRVKTFTASVAQAYQQQSKLVPALYVCKASSGAAVEEQD
jgi:galactokinase